MLRALMILKQMPSSVPAKLVTPMSVPTQLLSVKVIIIHYSYFARRNLQHLLHQHIIDSCQVNNGGCDPNAACYHDQTTNAVLCACNTGYTNVGTGSTVVCKGNTYFSMFNCSYAMITCFHFTNIDTCLVNNGGCDPNAACTHDSTTNAVMCICKTGYTNTGKGSTVVCTGNIFG